MRKTVIALLVIAASSRAAIYYLDRSLKSPAAAPAPPPGEDRAGLGDFEAQALRLYRKWLDAREGAASDAASAVIAELRGQPPELRSAFWSMLGLEGVARPQITADGRRVFFVYTKRGSESMATAPRIDSADQNDTAEVYVWELGQANLRCVGPMLPDAMSAWPAASGAGEVLGFVSLGVGPRSGRVDFGVRELPSGRVEWLLPDSPKAIGEAVIPNGPTRAGGRVLLSRDGLKALYFSGSSVDPSRYLIFQDRPTQKARLLSGKAARIQAAALSADGLLAAVIGSADGFGGKGEALGIYLVPTAGGAPAQVPLPAGAALASAASEGSALSLSADGSRLAFAVELGGVAQVFLYDARSGLCSLISANAGRPGAGPSSEPALSADGTKLAFASEADLSQPGAPRAAFRQVYLHDATRGAALSLVSRGPAGRPGTGHSDSPSISSDGSAIVFLTAAHDLLPIYSPAVAEQVMPQKGRQLRLLRPAENQLYALGALVP